MPINSSTVVMQENVIFKNKKILIKKMPSHGENCRLEGEDIKKGKKILLNGEKINSTNLNLIAAIGKKHIFVKKKIRIGYFTSGNEIKSITEKLKGALGDNFNVISFILG